MKFLYKGKFMRACESKWRQMENRALPCNSCSSADCDELICCPWSYTLWPFLQHLKTIRRISKNNNDSIPKDVPKGHTVVYVGQSLKRYVIKITLLKHPLFKALLDQVRDELGFTANSKLWIPCEENMFLDVVRCASSSRDRRFWVCL